MLFTNFKSFHMMKNIRGAFHHILRAFLCSPFSLLQFVLVAMPAAVSANDSVFYASYFQIPLNDGLPLNGRVSNVIRRKGCAANWYARLSSRFQSICSAPFLLCFMRFAENPATSRSRFHLHVSPLACLLWSKIC